MTSAQPLPSLRQSLPVGERPIIFFDGVCVMCNGFVDLMLQIDRSAKIRLAPLQGKTAQEYLPPLPDNQREWTIYYLDETGLYDRSEAVVQICQRLGSWTSLLSWTSLVSLPLRDGLYTWIARHRYDLLGRRETCRMIPPEHQHRFLP
ncbi:MAG: DCC1-like thiol-disulfide oxidoreductase family protein [Cyanobacteria bacterium P01_F01_bin.42]